MNNNCHLYKKNITLEQALLGGNFKIQTDNGQMIKVKLKPGSFNGQVIRLKAADGTSNLAKDTYIKLNVLDHPVYSIDGLNLHASLLLSPVEAELGCSKNIIAPNGKQIDVTVNAKSSEGDEITIKGAGLSDKNRSGDIIFRIKIDLLDYIDETILMDDLLNYQKILN